MTTAKRVGKYEIAEQIGVGGFGVVYKAWDPFIQRWVALKTCSATDPEATQRFFREAQLAGALQHPNITLIYDFGVEGKTPYFVQEFLSGTDLDDLLASRTVTLDGMLAILLQVCSGLDYAHSRGIVHRDIKPANVRVLEDGIIKIMDFGIAKSMEAESRLTQTGVALGTAGYLAPEQLSGKPLDPRTDLFSLGVMAYEMVTGVRPFSGPNLSNVIYQILNQDPVPPRQRNAACPERLERRSSKRWPRSLRIATEACASSPRSSRRCWRPCRRVGHRAGRKPLPPWCARSWRAWPHRQRTDSPPPPNWPRAGWTEFPPAGSRPSRGRTAGGELRSARRSWLWPSR